MILVPSREERFSIPREWEVAREVKSGIGWRAFEAARGGICRKSEEKGISISKMGMKWRSVCMYTWVVGEKKRFGMVLEDGTEWCCGRERGCHEMRETLALCLVLLFFFVDNNHNRTVLQCSFVRIKLAHNFIILELIYVKQWQKKELKDED